MKSDDRGARDALPPLTAEDELPLLSAEEELAFERALISAFRPEGPERDVHESLIDAALLDPVAEATPEELSRAAALRAALESGGSGPDVELARDLAAAFRVPAAGAGRNATLRAVSRALPRAKVVAIAFATTAALSLAAGIALVFVPAAREQRSAHFELAESRSLSPLFARDLETSGAGRGSGSELTSASERLDRIVAVRSRELRDNRFATWGVR